MISDIKKLSVISIEAKSQSFHQTDGTPISVLLIMKTKKIHYKIVEAITRDFTMSLRLTTTSNLLT